MPIDFRIDAREHSSRPRIMGQLSALNLRHLAGVGRLVSGGRSYPSKKSIVASIVAVKNRTFPVPSGPTGNPVLQRKSLPDSTSFNGTFWPRIFANETLYQLSYTPELRDNQRLMRNF